MSWSPKNAHDSCEIGSSFVTLAENGVPYGESAVLTEYFDLFQERDGTTMLFVTAVVQDPVYLEQRYIVISHFRKEADGSKWDPTPCSARW